MIRARCSSVIRRGRPPRSSGSSEPNPRTLNAWMTLRTCDSSVPTSAAICCGLIRVADAHTINARSRLTSDAALRESRLSRLPSSGNSSLTNTDGGRITTSKLGMRPSSPATGDFRSTDTRRATSRVIRRGYPVLLHWLPTLREGEAIRGSKHNLRPPTLVASTMRRLTITLTITATLLLGLGAASSQAAMKLGLEDESVFVSGNPLVSSLGGYLMLKDLGVKTMRVLITQASVQSGSSFDFASYQSTI